MSVRMRSTVCRPRRVLILLCTVLFFYGFYLGGVQLVIGEVSQSYDMNSTGMGGLVSAQHIAGIVLPVLMGAAADRIGKKTVLSLFAAVFAVGCAFAGFSGSLAVYLLGTVCIGAGYSVCESVSSAVLSELDETRGARYVNLSQAVLSLGAVISPLLVQGLRSRFSLSWRLPFLICAAAYTLLSLAILATVFPRRANVPKQQAQRGGRFFSSGIFVLLFAAIILYVGLENGISYFVETLFSRTLNAADLGAAALSAYWIGMTVSRLVFSAVPARPQWVVLGAFLCSAAALGGLALSASPYLSVGLCAAAGFAYGPIWSTLVYLATRQFPHATAGAAGRMSAGCGLGGIFYPLLMGAVCDRFGIRASFCLLALTAAAGALCSLLAGLRIKKSNAA